MVYVRSEESKRRAAERAKAWYADPENKKRAKAWRDAKRAADPETFLERNRAYSQAWRDRNPEQRRIVWIKHKYRLTDEQVQHLLDTRGLCESCGLEQASVIDHDHQTGAFRGQLCQSCNRAAGCVKDDPHRARSLADYLTRTNAQQGAPLQPGP